tara:strand:- start:149 stop:982 length:834 start_codon:yes stop_codon:yes gene_type:complete
MKKIILLFTLLVLLFPKITYSQDEVLGAAGIIAGAAAVAIAIHQVEERMELFATDYIIKNYDLNAFELKLNGLDGAKTFDPSSISVLSFNVTPIDYESGNKINSEKIALVVFLDSGWKNEFGIDFTKVNFKPFDKEKWNGLFTRYIGLASGVKIIDGKIPAYKKTKKSTSKNIIRVNGKEYEPTGATLGINNLSIGQTGVFLNDTNLILPFKKITGDTYFIADYSDEFKIVFNEKSLGIYSKELEKLLQIKRSLVDEITDFLNNGTQGYDYNIRRPR